MAKLQEQPDYQKSQRMVKLIAHGDLVGVHLVRIQLPLQRMRSEGPGNDCKAAQQRTQAQENWFSIGVHRMKFSVFDPTVFEMQNYKR